MVPGATAIPATALLKVGPLAPGQRWSVARKRGRVFQTIDEVRDAVRTFTARYNAEWLIEKNGYLSPLDARAARLDTTLQRAA